MQCHKCCVAIFLLAMVSMAAVAAAYDPIADNKVPSPKSFNSVARRRLLQWGGPQQLGFGGPAFVGPPYWTPGVPQRFKGEVHTDTANERRFDVAQK